MTLRELINHVTENPSLDLYLENFQLLDYEISLELRGMITTTEFGLQSIFVDKETNRIRLGIAEWECTINEL